MNELNACLPGQENPVLKCFGRNWDPTSNGEWHSIGISIVASSFDMVP